MMDIDALIRDAQARVRESITETVDVVLGGSGDADTVPVTMEKLPGHEWVALRTLHPPREGSQFDMRMGCDIVSLTRAYPAERIKVAGEPVTEDQWRSIFDSVDAVHVENLTDLVVTVNFAPSLVQAGDVGKASRAGSGKKRNSPANSESHPVDSEGGSPRK